MNTFALNHAVRELRVSIKSPADLLKIWKTFDSPTVNVPGIEKMPNWQKNLGEIFDQ